jgi:hypothetical protein
LGTGELAQDAAKSLIDRLTHQATCADDLIDAILDIRWKVLEIPDIVLNSLEA